MQDFAKDFYLSGAWRRVRNYIFKRDFGICVRCGAPGEIVHHKIHLTAENIHDENISLNEENLELLCRDCHAIEHSAAAPTASGLYFDENGDLVGG